MTPFLEIFYRVICQVSFFGENPVEDLVGVTVEHLVEHADHFNVGFDHSQVIKTMRLVGEEEGSSAENQVVLEHFFEVLTLLGIALLSPLLFEVFEGSGLSQGIDLCFEGVAP